MKAMDFSDWPGERRRHSRSYDNDEQRRQAGKDAFSCFFISESQYWQPAGLKESKRKFGWARTDFVDFSDQ